MVTLVADAVHLLLVKVFYPQVDAPSPIMSYVNALYFAPQLVYFLHCYRGHVKFIRHVSF